MIRKCAAAGLLAGLLFAGFARADDADNKYDLEIDPQPKIMLPTGKVSGEVVLFSDGDGWNAKEEAISRKLVSEGSIVIGIDFPTYIKAIRNYDVSRNDGCIYLVSDIETLSQNVQRSVADSSYQLPIIAGVGEGGALALAIAAQTPDATVAQTLAVDPLIGIPLTGKELCTPVDKKVVGDRTVMGLSDGPLPDPISVTFTPDAPADGRQHVEDLKKDFPDIKINETSEDAYVALGNEISALLKSGSSASSPLGLPISVMDAKPTHDTVAIIYSGDGGWRDIDKEVGSDLQEQGIPVVGVDTLHYFWSERKPQETADDLGRIIDFYTRRYNVHHVALIGYSFGADVLPASYNLLKPGQRARIVQLSLLSLSKKVDYVISVMGWLGADSEGKGGSTVTDLKTIDPKLVQCLYGKDDEDDSACPQLKGTGAEVIELEGGHHFDDDYDTLSKKIIDGLMNRLS